MTLLTNEKASQFKTIFKCIPMSYLCAIKHEIESRKNELLKNEINHGMLIRELNEENQLRETHPQKFSNTAVEFTVIITILNCPEESVKFYYYDLYLKYNYIIRICQCEKFNFIL